RVELLPSAGLDGGEPCIDRPRLLVWTLRGERVEDIRDRDDARGERDVRAALPVRVALPVPALVMLARDRAGGLEETGLAEHGLAVDAVLLDHLELVARRGASAPDPPRSASPAFP